MKASVAFVERKRSESVSIERVFRQIARDLPDDRFELSFTNVPYGNGISAIIKNLLSRRPIKADIYHITGDIHYMALRLPASSTILTIHDLIFLHRRKGLRRYILKKLLLDLPLRRLRYVTAVSDATKAEIIKYTGIDQNRIVVIENPIFAHFTPGEVKQFDADCPWILHVGTAANKNLAKLIEAVRGLSCKLRIVGRLSNEMIELLKTNGTLYENVCKLDEHQMVDEYRNADIVSLCSNYEGFGLPIIEAQAMHKPVVTSNIAPMNTIAGDGAALVDPADAESIRGALQSIISDPAYRNRLIEAGSRNLERFDSEIIARKYSDLYEKVLNS